MPIPDNPGYREHLADVAAVYLAALNVPSRPKPMAAVVAKWRKSPATASRWIRDARDVGLIPPVVDGEGLRGTDVCPMCGAPPSRWGKSGRR